MINKIYYVTKLGEKMGGDISAEPTDGRKVLRELREAPMDVDEIHHSTGIPSKRLHGVLRNLSHRRLITELTKGEMQ